MDVPADDIFFPWVGQATAAGYIGGYEDGTFRTKVPMLREQAGAVLARLLSGSELRSTGIIRGATGTYLTLDDWYAHEGASVLARFADVPAMLPHDAPGVAYLVYHQVMGGRPAGGRLYLAPKAVVTRAQSVALILHAAQIRF
jgi:hypothetical protein